jgi:hypothetical protein
MLFLRKTAILKKELEYERIDGPTLRQLTNLSSPNPIFHINHDDILNAMASDINAFSRLIIRSGVNSNLRVLYMVLLLLV